MLFCYILYIAKLYNRTIANSILMEFSERGTPQVKERNFSLMVDKLYEMDEEPKGKWLEEVVRKKTGN